MWATPAYDFFLREYKKELDKLNKIINEQKKQIERMQTSIKVNNQRAELLYTNYKLIQDIITELKKAREKDSWQEIKEKLKGHKLIKDINEKEGKIILTSNKKHISHCLLQ